jgi:uncharacterized protein YjdB
MEKYSACSARRHFRQRRDQRAAALTTVTVKRDRHIIVAEPRITLGNPVCTMTWQWAENTVANASHTKTVEYHRRGAGCDCAAAAGFVADANDAFHG